MAWTDPNAKDFTVGQVLTSNEMDTYVLANTADLDDRLVGGLVVARVTLTNDASSAVDAWEQWGTEEATIADPGRQVVVTAQFTGNFQQNSTTSRVVGEVRVQISTDGGTSWDTGVKVRAGVDNSDARESACPCQHTVTATPTGQVQARVQFQQVTLGSAGDLDAHNGNLLMRIDPVGN